MFPELSVATISASRSRSPPAIACGPGLSRSARRRNAARVAELMAMGGLADKADRLVGELRMATSARLKS